MANSDRKALHDALLAEMPPGATHETCSYCLATTETPEMPEGGTLVDKTYTEDELQAAVSNATASLEADIKNLKDAALVSEVSAAVAAAKAEAEAEIEELRANLDNAVLAAQAARSEHDAFVAGLEELVASSEREAEMASRRDSRLEEAKSFGFSDEHLAANAERFVAMSDEEWEGRLADWRAIHTPKGEVASVDDQIPTRTALWAAREDTTTNQSGIAEIREAMHGSLTGTDFRTL
jgi:hypothetical protein